MRPMIDASIEKRPIKFEPCQKSRPHQCHRCRSAHWCPNARSDVRLLGLSESRRPTVSVSLTPSQANSRAIGLKNRRSLGEGAKNNLSNHLPATVLCTLFFKVKAYAREQDTSACWR